MGNLTNQYVSQSFQGLLTLANANTGITSTLQSVQDGLGNNLPIKVSNTQVTITGSFFGDGSGLTGITVSIDSGSLVTTSSFNAYTSSNDSKVNSLIASTGSYATTSSLTALSQSIASTDLSQNNRLGSLEAATSSYITNSQTSSMSVASASFASFAVSSSQAANAVSASQAQNAVSASQSQNSVSASFASNATSASYSNNSTSASYAQFALSASYAPDISNRNGLITTGSIGQTQSITGSLNVEGTISATSASFTYVNTVYETASVIYSSGSNQFGDASNDTQTLYGTVNLPNGPLVVTGSVTASAGFNGNLQGTASYATNALSSSHAINADTASYVANATTASIAYDLVVYGKCDNPGGLTKGTIVRITGANGDNPLFNSASWEDDANSANTLGMLTADVAHNGFANIVVQGTVIGINTSGMTAGDMLYLSSSGQYTTSSVPAPYHEVRLGQVLRPQLNNGSAYVSIDNGYELTELHDVDITSVAVGDVLTYVSGAYGQWVNKTVDELGYLQTSSFNTYTASMDARTGSYATTGSNIFNGLQTINVNDVANRGILIRSGSGAQQQSILFKTDEFGGQSQPTVYMEGINSYWQSTGNLFIENAPGGIGSGSMNFTTNGGITFTSNGTGQTINLNNGNGTTQITGSAKIIGNTTITGSLIVSGSQSNTGSLGVRNGNFDINSNNTTVNTSLYLTSSLAGQANMIFGWGDNPGAGGASATQANYTGSLRITGSNNIVSLPQIRATGLGGAAGLQGYISGSHNIINGNTAGIYLTTSSLLSPKTSANFLNNNGSIQMTFTTSSLSAPIVSNNGIFGGGITVNHPSGSVVASSNIMVGQITSTQNFVTNVVPSITSNNVLGPVTLNHISSSISYTGNYSNAPVTVNNHLSSSNITNNSLAIGTNHFVGGSSNTGVSIWVSGSQSSNVARNIIDNILGGKNIIVSSSFVSSSNSNLVASVVYGQNLTVSGSHASTVGGSAFFGRYNGLSGLEDTQNIVFAVGTGTGTSNRRTGFYIDSGSNVVTSGSFRSIGNTTVTGSLIATGSVSVTGSVNISNVMNLTAQNPLPAGTIGDLAVSSSNELYFYNGAWTLIV